MPDEHAKYPPSSLEYWELCPHFENKPGDPEDTRVGDLVHKAVEKGDPSLVEGNEEAEWMYEGCMRRVEAVREKGFEIEHEVRGYSHREDCWGTIDVLGFSREMQAAYVLDFKCGRVPVSEAESNAQIAAYASFAFNANAEIAEVGLVIVEIYFAREDKSTFATFRRSDLGKLQLRIDRTIELIGRGPKNVTYNCRNCAHFTSCDEVQRQIVPTTKNTVSLGYLANPENIKTPEDAVKALEAKEVLGPWYTNWEEQVKARCLEIAKIADLPGYEIAEKKGNASCKLDADEVEDFVERIRRRIPPFRYDLLELSVSPTAIEKQAVKDALRMAGLKSARSKEGKAVRDATIERLKEFWEDGTFTRGEPTEYIKKVTKGSQKQISPTKEKTRNNK